jgi:glycosyltransferase involved in cell wall biosynthesis
MRTPHPRQVSSGLLDYIRMLAAEKVTPRSPVSRPSAGSGLLVVLPAHDEAESVAEVVGELQRDVGCIALVVSDASRDDTAEVARRQGARVIELSQQIGAWGATQTGFRYAHRHGFRQVASLDADGQHAPASLLTLLAAQQETGADVVIGTFPERLSPLKRLAWVWFRGITGLGVEDLTSGLRLYGPRALQVLASAEATLLDYQDVGVLLLLRKYGMTIHEVPVTMHPRLKGHSRVFASWFTVARYMAQTTVLCLAQMGGRRRRLPGLPR